MKRVPLQRRTALKSKGKVPSSDYRPRRPPPAFDEQTKAAVRRRSGNQCEIRATGCTGRASHFHHRKLRRHGDHRDLNCLHACAACHSHVHHNVEEAYVMGWLVQSYRDPAEVPVRRGGG